MFPLVLSFDLIFFGQYETWISFKGTAFDMLFKYSDWSVIIILMSLSLLTFFRGMMQFHAISKLTVPQHLNCQVA